MVNIDGEVENGKELEVRLNESRDEKLKVYRHHTRRKSVRALICD